MKKQVLEKGITFDEKTRKYIVDTTYKKVRIKKRFDNYFPAKNHLDKRKKEIDLEIEEKKIGTVNITLEQVFEEMLANQIDDKGNEIFESNYYKLNHKTVRLYKSVFKNHLKELSSEKIKDVDFAKIKKTLNKITHKSINQNGELIYSDVPNRAKTVLERIFEYALDSKYINETPRFTSVKFTRPKSEIKTENFIKTDDFILFCNTIKNMPKKVNSAMNNDDFIFLIKVYFYTGVRSGEGRGLKVEDFCVEKEGNETKYKVIIKRQMEDDSKNKTSFLKNGHQTRVALLTKENYDYFISFFNLKKYKADNFIFDFNLSGNVISRQKIERNLKKAVEFAKEKDARLQKLALRSLQGFRVSNNYYLQSLGGAYENIASAQGHSVAVQQAYYSYVNDSDLNSVLNKKER